MNFILTFLFIIFSCSIAHAKNWFPFEKVGANTVYMNKAACEIQEGQKCFDISKKDIRELKLGILPPIVNNSIDCASDTACQQTLDDGYSCFEGTPTFDDKANWPNFDFSLAKPFPRSNAGWFLWCRKQGLMIDDAKKAQLDAEKVAQAQQDATIAQGELAISLGQKAKKLMVGYIKLKNLPKADRKSLRTDLKSIISALDVGSIDIAIDEIKALVEDPVVVTPQAKALILKVFSDAGYPTD